jgi:hypothetical protein
VASIALICEVELDNNDIVHQLVISEVLDVALMMVEPYSHLKAYPSASGAKKCGSERGEAVLEQITDKIASGGTDDRFSPFLDRVPAALPG